MAPAARLAAGPNYFPSSTARAADKALPVIIAAPWRCKIASRALRQYTALRALLAKPQAILLDEPFSKLDKALRGQMRDYVFAHIKARGIPAVLVTHDRDDAPPWGRILEILPGGAVRDV